MKKLPSKLFGSMAMAALFCASMSYSTSVSAEDYAIDNVDVIITQEMQQNMSDWFIISDKIFFGPKE